jgi:hypothetical protein
MSLLRLEKRERQNVRRCIVAYFFLIIIRVESYLLVKYLDERRERERENISMRI